MKNFGRKISYRNLNKTSNEYGGKNRYHEGKQDTQSQQEIKFDKPSNRQYTLGLKQSSQNFKSEKNQLLKQREQNYKNDVQPKKKSQLSFDYGSHQYIQTENPSPSPKFYTKSSVSGGQQYREHQYEVIVQKINKLKPFMQKMINQCQDENLQVVQGLKQLKQAHQRILRELQSQSAKEFNRKKHRYRVEDDNKKIKKSIGDKMRQLKSILNKIIKDTKNDKGQIKKSIQNIKSIYDQLQEEQLNYENKYHRKKKSFQSDEIQMPSKKLATELSTVYRYNAINQQDDQNNEEYQQVLDTREQILGLDNLENRIVIQIKNLRQNNAKLINQLKSEKQKNNFLIVQYKKMQKSYKKLKNQNKEDSEIQSESIITKSKKGSQDYTNNFQRNSSETIKLKTRIKQLQSMVSKLKDSETNKLNEIKSLRKQLEQKASEFQQNKSSNQNLLINKQNQTLKNQLSKMQKLIKQLQSRNKVTKPQYNSELRQELKKLKKENEELRIQTINLLKNKEINYHNRIKTEDVQHLKQKNYPRNEPTSNYNTNKTFDPRKYSANQENLSKPLEKKKSNDSNRLIEYRELLSGLQNVATKND